MSLDLDGLVALVTGGASGIGAASAVRLTEGGAQVAVLDRDEPPSPGGTAMTVRADVTDQSSVDAAVASAVETLGRLDIVVNSAGIGAVGDVTANNDDEWLGVYQVNVLGIVRVMRAALPHLRQSTSASVVNLASIAATAGLPQRACYSASKGAVAALTRAMAADFAPLGIRVNAVSPGTVDTPWVARLLAAAPDPAATRVALEARQPMGRLATAEEVAEAVAYLASPSSSFTTGSCLTVDGGMDGLRLPSPSS